MSRCLSVTEVRGLHQRLIAQSGGSPGLRDGGALASAVAQPQMTFGGQDFYPGLAAQASALGFSLILNHPFIDGNKRIGHLAMETFLVLNGYEIVAPVSEQERVILAVAAGQIEREEFTQWLASHIQVKASEPQLP